MAIAERFERFVKQAREEYMGTPRRVSFFFDGYGEEHVVVEMHQGGKPSFWLDWIGAELADQPDEHLDPPALAKGWQVVE